MNAEQPTDRERGHRHEGTGGESAGVHPSRDDSANWLTLSEAARVSPGRPSSNAVWRWCRKGVRSRSGRTVRLGHFRAGRRVFTTRESLTRFFEELTAADVEHFDGAEAAPNRRPAPSSKRHRQQAIDRAKARLDRAGI